MPRTNLYSQCPSHCDIGLPRMAHTCRPDQSQILLHRKLGTLCCLDLELLFRLCRYHMMWCGSSRQRPIPQRKACTRSFPFRFGTRRECTAGRMPAPCHSDIALWHSLSSSSRWRSGLIYRSRIRSKKLGPIRYQTYQGCTAGTMPDQ